jgi:hypothetical protein
MITALIHRDITGKDNKGEELRDVPRDGHLLFITHEAFQRMGTTWPEEARHFELIIDETPEVVVTRQPFKLCDSH